MSLTSYRAAPPRVNRAPYLINGLADGKEMLGGAQSISAKALIDTTEARDCFENPAAVAPRKTLTPYGKGDTPCECKTLRDHDEWTRKTKRNKPRRRKIRSS